MLTPSFRGPSESSAPSKKLASVELPRTFRVKRHREPQTKRLCLRRTPAHFRVKRLLPLWVSLILLRAPSILLPSEAPPPVSNAAGCYFIAKAILAYGDLTETLRNASAQFPRILHIFSGVCCSIRILIITLGGASYGAKCSCRCCCWTASADLP